MTNYERALSFLVEARIQKRRSSQCRNNARSLMEGFTRFCERHGISPAEVKQMQEETAEVLNHGRKENRKKEAHAH